MLILGRSGHVRPCLMGQLGICKRDAKPDTDFVLVRIAKFFSAHLSLEKNKDDYLVQDNYFMVQHHYRENCSFEIVSSLEV